MKKFFLLLLLISGCLTLFSQAPEGFSYHAVVRDILGDPLVTQAVSFRFTIIQGTPIGTSVFRETHNVTTDAFGGVSIVINNGTSKIGLFETINWGADAYFLKVEIDKTGGTSYTDMGTTQLLSVPYSLYSKVAANGFSGNYNDLTNKPITDGSETKISAGNKMIVSGSGTLTQPYVITNGFSGDYNDLTNKPITNGSETNLAEGVNMTITGTGTISDPYTLNSESAVTSGDNMIVTGIGTKDDPYIIKERIHYVGESWGGGIVFYVYDKGRHGLVAATTDQDPGIQWYNGTKRYTNTTGDGVNAGEMNTMLIIALQTNDNPMSNFAAKVCADYTVNVEGVTLGDWYLPSKYELAILFFQKNIVGNFVNDYYWSSTEFSSLSAWSVNFSDGIQYNLNKSLPYGVRAIRAF